MVPVKIKPLTKKVYCKKCKYFDTKTKECKLFSSGEYYSAEDIRINEELCGPTDKYFIELFTLFDSSFS